MLTLYRHQAERLQSLRNYRCVLTHSDYMRSEYVRHGIPAERVVSLPYGVAPLRPAMQPIGAALRSRSSSFDARWPLDLDTWPSLEAQVAALSDDIAYVNHDIDDGLRAELFDASDLIDVPLAGPIFRALMDAHAGLERGRLIGEAVRRVITRMVADVAQVVLRLL